MNLQCCPPVKCEIKSAKGRTVDYKNEKIIVPVDVDLYICPKCDQMFMTKEQERDLYSKLESRHAVETAIDLSKQDDISWDYPLMIDPYNKGIK